MGVQDSWGAAGWQELGHELLQAGCRALATHRAAGGRIQLRLGHLPWVPILQLRGQQACGYEALGGAPAPWRQQHEVFWGERAQSNVVPGLPPPCVAPCALSVGRRWGGTGTAAPTRPASSWAQFWGKQLPGTCLTAPPKPTVSVAPGPASSPWGASLLTGGNGTGAPGFPSPFLGGHGTPWPQRGRLAAGGGTGTAWEEAMWPSVLGSKGITPRARMGWSFADLRHRRPAAAKEGNMEAGGQGPGQRAPSTPPPPAHPCCRTSSQQLGTGGDRVGLPLPGPPGLQGPEAAADPRLSSAPP